jgi:hypothetical protein
MIKQNWKVSTDEVKRILEMHENATKKHYLLTEQITVTKKLEPKTFELPAQSFESGYHSAKSLKPEQKNGITNTLNQIATYLKEKKGVPMSIQIIAGESTPNNYDNENKRSLKSGELAKLRGETMKKILTDFFQNLVNNGEIPSMPKIEEPTNNLNMQREPFKKGDNPKDPKFLKDQFIRFTVVASGEETTTCLVDLKIIFNYSDTPDSKIKCRGGHSCDDAVFDVYLNKVKVGTANLNNYNQGPRFPKDRRSEIVVTSDKVNSIISGKEFQEKKELILWYVCVPQSSDGCHSNIPEVYILNKEDKQLFPSSSDPNPCVAPYSQRGKDKGPWTLMVLDGCGNPIKRAAQVSNELLQKIQDELSAEERERIAKQKEEDRKINIEVTKIATTEGLEFIPGSLSTSDIFNIGNFEILSQEDQGNFYALKIKNPNQPRTISGIFDPIRKSRGRYTIEKGQEIIVKYQILRLQIPKKLRKEFLNSRITEINPKEGYYFAYDGLLVPNKNKPNELVWDNTAKRKVAKVEFI